VELFQAMPRYDQQHALKVVDTLARQGHSERDLLAAALLHDVGKSVTPGTRLRLWHRVTVVLIHVSWPSLLERLARDEPGSWRWPFYVQLHHAGIGAEAARRAGCSATTVDLIHGHEQAQDQTRYPLLAALQAADSEN
jgi:putative nucleotidyltransferase with HDIG domain